MRQTVAVSLPRDLTQQLDDVALEEGSSRSEVVREALRRYLAVRQFQKVRASILPFAEAAGIVDDEEVFRLMS